MLHLRQSPHVLSRCRNSPWPAPTTHPANVRSARARVVAQAHCRCHPFCAGPRSLQRRALVRWLSRCACRWQLRACWTWSYLFRRIFRLISSSENQNRPNDSMQTPAQVIKQRSIRLRRTSRHKALVQCERRPAHADVLRWWPHEVPASSAGGSSGTRLQYQEEQCKHTVGPHQHKLHRHQAGYFVLRYCRSPPPPRAARASSARVRRACVLPGAGFGGAGRVLKLQLFVVALTCTLQVYIFRISGTRSARSGAIWALLADSQISDSERGTMQQLCKKLRK